MSASFNVSAALAASIERMKARIWLDPIAQAYEQGAIATRPVVGQSAKTVKASRFTPRPCRRRLTDQERVKRRDRKRMLGGSSALPDTMRHHYTEGERAVLCVIAGEVKRHGICDLSIGEIGDRAGVGRTTVQNTVHQARLLGDLQVRERPQRGTKNLTNIVRITSAAWLSWIRRAPSASPAIGSKFSKNMSTTKIIDLRKQEASQESGCWKMFAGRGREPEIRGMSRRPPPDHRGRLDNDG